MSVEADLDPKSRLSGGGKTLAQRKISPLRSEPTSVNVRELSGGSATGAWRVAGDHIDIDWDVGPLQSAPVKLAASGHGRACGPARPH